MHRKRRIPRRARFVARQHLSGYYASSVHPKAWRYAIGSKIAFGLWGLMSEVFGAALVFTGIMLFALATFTVPLMLFG